MMTIYQTKAGNWIDTDPCHHCQHYGEYYDGNTGITDCDCDYDYGFHEDFGKTPCPGFKPILASNGLFEQLHCEEEERFYRECEKEYKESYKEEDW